jgi:Zn-finger nucleic acid-binding protein
VSRRLQLQRLQCGALLISQGESHMPKKKAAKKAPKKTSPTVSRHKDSIYTQEGKTYSHRTKKAKPTKESPEHI